MRRERLFGTDGIRGIANTELTPELALRVGRAVGVLLGSGGALLIGRDTRLSGEMLEAALTAGICSAGASVQSAGVVPTPAVAFLTHRLGSPCGIALSASHNPIEDNGIKLFGPDGFKLPDELEDRVEAACEVDNLPRPTGEAVGTARKYAEAEDAYLNYLLGLGLRPPRGLRVVVDCAYGAAYSVAPRLWEAAGATVIPIHDRPEGARINVDCGSTNPEPLRRAVLEHGAAVGFAHDGDADRVIAVDERGNVVDGDMVLSVCAKFLAEQGRLNGRVVVATVMSNLGLERSLDQLGIRLERTRVGDRYVLERMRAVGSNLGGEQSGHVIFLNEATTGDGLVTALHLAHVMDRMGKRLSELTAEFVRFPQVLRNVRVKDRNAWADDTQVRAAIKAAEQRLNGHGRILVRASGTEPVVRVMVEAQDAQEAESVAGVVSAVINDRHGRTAAASGG